MSGRPIAACLAAAVIAACNSAPPPAAKADLAAVEKDIHAQVARWNEAIAAQNDSVIADLYADNAVLMPPNQPRLSGHENIRGFWKGLWVIKPKLVITPGQIAISDAGDVAIEDGSFTLEYAGADGKPITDTGKYIDIWKKTDKGWKVIRDIYNTDLPPAAPPAPKK